MRRIGCYEEALFSYEKAIKIKIDYSMAWFGCGHALRDLKRYHEAIYCYDKCLELQPDFHWVWYTKARYHTLEGNIDLALESLNEAIELIADRYTELAKTEPIFDALREDIRFQKLIPN
ncbi:MAG: tetratricopeptide repeat protein [Cyanomargarita calcarea GSE-NOS-MK-12-04C]|uniref:Tetratricopeptide repeat protein n=1 Tax=Cyanomargarita calcarea GSE-NOS-MK-12-04C TaxID=2839659 RepID=A0A951QRM9_9CYAN|nr:tetratricopeptide repeat protein [Cyanomargarita calcarea GSE-NOS-MK-12-04C]